jgi:hypothetical protein
MSIIHVFIMQIFREAEKAPHYPHSAEQGVGSSGSFQPEAVGLVVALAFEAVSIRGKSDNFSVSGGFLW